MNNINERFEKMQENINLLRNQLDFLKQTAVEDEDTYEVFPATELYHKTSSDKKFIDFNSLAFTVHKYFIEEIRQRPSKPSKLNKELVTNLSNLITSTFNGEDYVLIISNEEHFRSGAITKQAYKIFAKNKVGKITKCYIREHILNNEYTLQALTDVGENKIAASVKHSYLNVLDYYGHSIENQNVIFLNDEFGYDDAVTRVFIELKPKMLLNLVFNGYDCWFGNVD